MLSTHPLDSMSESTRRGETTNSADTRLRAGEAKSNSADKAPMLRSDRDAELRKEPAHGYAYLLWRCMITAQRRCRWVRP